jgi:hypothetical protein
MFYKDWCKTPLGVLVDKVVDFPEGVHDYDDVLSIGEDEGGIVVCTSGGRWVDRNSRYGGTPMPMGSGHADEEFQPPAGGCSCVVWDNASSNTVYGDVCLGVCIGKAGDRSALTTVAEMNEAYGKRQEEWRKWDYRKGCHTMTRSVVLFDSCKKRDVQNLPGHYSRQGRS